MPPLPSFGIFANATKPLAVQAVLPLVRYLRSRGARCVIEREIAALLPGGAGLPAASRDDIAADVDVIVTFGGDGTILAAVRAALPHGTPILGVNLGKLGFLADITADEARAAVRRIIAGEYRIEKRMTLRAAVAGVRGAVDALNDVVVGRSGTAHVIRVEAWVDDDFLATYLADGIIISTPTGSTAYSLATGGPIIAPSTDAIVISPISPHTLTARPIVVPGGSRVTLRAETADGSILVTADGQPVQQNLHHAEVTVRKGARGVRLVKDVGPNYFAMLRKKLSWAQDHRLAASDMTPPG